MDDMYTTPLPGIDRYTQLKRRHVYKKEELTIAQEKVVLLTNKHKKSRAILRACMKVDQDITDQELQNNPLLLRHGLQFSKIHVLSSELMMTQSEILYKTSQALDTAKQKYTALELSLRQLEDDMSVLIDNMH